MGTGPGTLPGTALTGDPKGANGGPKPCAGAQGCQKFLYLTTENLMTTTADTASNYCKTFQILKPTEKIRYERNEKFGGGHAGLEPRIPEYSA